ncbi:MAG: HAMP domain-containing histidine kinase [Gammaproteobacteria bacterium]|nr:HAMP domain-containing histidine kinase [Gammaproteobacteria bacterium]
MSKFIFPLRLKVLITVLAFLMVVVGVITATMADLFEKDKTAYVRDFTGVVTSDAQNEIDLILSGYVSASKILGEVMFADYLDPGTKQRIVAPVFEAYPQILGIVTVNRLDEPVSIYNVVALQDYGSDASELTGFSSLLTDHTGMNVHGATLDSGRSVVTLKFYRDPGADSGGRSLVMVLTPDLFRRALYRASAFEALLIDVDGDAVIHTSGENVDWAQSAVRAMGSLESGASGVIDIVDDGVQYFVGAAPVDLAKLTVVMRISASTAYLTARQLLTDLIFVGLVIVLIASIGGVFMSRRFTKPLERLSTAVRKIAKGNFDVNVDIKSTDEIGQLSSSFNDMADELREREQSLKSAQLALVQSEKMAAVGTLSAGLAHEVKNPLSAVLGYAQLSKRKLEQPEVVRQHLDTIEAETKRCNEIIGNLMQFSRQEKGEFADIHLNEVIEKAVGIVDHQLGLKNVHVQTNLANDDPVILGNANQLQQVLMNLAINAQQAMEPEGGTVDIESYTDENHVHVSVSDTGPGIPDDVAAKIFEPFYTTKAAGQGTGLGLSVTYGIIRDHKGHIHVERSDAGGARFVIQFPLDMTRELATSGSYPLGHAS